MGRLVLYMSMSLDGFIAGPGDTKDNPFGTKGHRLHEWRASSRRKRPPGTATS
jgi:hypothetical protein